jgi:hypothetical protein
MNGIYSNTAANELDRSCWLRPIERWRVGHRWNHVWAAHDAFETAFKPLTLTVLTSSRCTSPEWTSTIPTPTRFG